MPDFLAIENEFSLKSHWTYRFGFIYKTRRNSFIMVSNIQLPLISANTAFSAKLRRPRPSIAKGDPNKYLFWGINMTCLVKNLVKLV